MSIRRSQSGRSFDGSRVLVTGGRSGLGLALTRQFVDAGATVLVVDVHADAPAGVLPDGVLYRQLDVRSDQAWGDPQLGGVHVGATGRHRQQCGCRRGWPDRRRLDG